MLLFVPLQGFPAPMRKAGSCRALYSAEWQDFCSFLLRSLVVSGWWCSMPSIWGIFLFSFHLLSVLCKWISLIFVLLLQLPVLWLVWQWGYSVTMSVFAQLALKLPSLPSQVYLSGFQKPHSAADLPSWIWHLLIPFSSLPNKFCLAWSAVKFLILVGLWHFWEIFTPPSVVTCLRPVESWNE